MRQTSSLGRVVAASSFGGVVEWYDYAIYGFFSVTLAKAFFPSDDPVASLLAVYGVFALTAVARPLGGVIFGHIGDRIGRRAALVMSVTAMGLCTTLVAFLPTYETAGVWASVLLTILRLAQGVSVGGEYTGASVYVAEHAAPKRRGFLGSIVEAATDAGFLLGSGIGALTATFLGQSVVEDWGWRVPFAFGGVLALVTLAYRARLPQSPYEGAASAEAAPVVLAIRVHWRTLLHYQSLMLVAASGFYTVFVYGTSFVEQTLKFSTAYALDISTVAMIVILISALMAGYLSDRIGRRPIFMAVAVAAIGLSWPLFHLLTQPEFMKIFVAELGFAIILGAAFGMLPATMAEMIPAEVRCSGAGLAYNVCMAVVSGTSPLIAVLIVSKTGYDAAPAFFIMLAGALQLWGALMLKERSGTPLS